MYPLEIMLGLVGFIISNFVSFDDIEQVMALWRIQGGGETIKTFNPLPSLRTIKGVMAQYNIFCELYISFVRLDLRCIHSCTECVRLRSF